jgi:hypothetical protein
MRLMKFTKRQRHEASLSKAERILLNQGLCVCTVGQLREQMSTALQAARAGKNRSEMQVAQVGVRTLG